MIYTGGLLTILRGFPYLCSDEIITTTLVVIGIDQTIKMEINNFRPDKDCEPKVLGRPGRLGKVLCQDPERERAWLGQC